MHALLRLGTRASQLARWQAGWVSDRLAESGVDVQLVTIKTDGDRQSTDSISRIEGRGVFTKQIQQALLQDQIDLTVHSLKDLPTEPVPGLKLAAVPERESAADVIVSRDRFGLLQLPRNARVGTGSPRRRTQLMHLRPDLVVGDIRGNVETRLAKLDEGQFDAIVLAEAGLNRLELADRITEVLSWTVMLPAIGQGALGIEVRQDDHTTAQLLAPLDDWSTRAAVTAERTMLSALNGGCLAPIGAWARDDNGDLKLDGVVLSPDGSRRLAASATGATDDPQQIGNEVAASLIRQGAEELIEASRQSS